MAKKKTIKVKGIDIALLVDKEEDYLSLTDIARKVNKRTDVVISNWLRNRNTVEFLGVWEQLYNPDFNPIEFDGIKKQTGLNSFFLTAKEWIERTNAIGVKSKAGRYGGTFAHRDIAFEFCSFVSPVFKLFLIKEFQRLKEFEARERLEMQDWNIKRLLTKINYSVHTDAIKDNILPPRLSKGKGLIYASEADMLNVALFGYTARQWKKMYPKAKGNMRSSASAEQLLVLANLEAINAELIRQGISQQERAIMLNAAAITQMKSILNSASWRSLPPEKE